MWLMTSATRRAIGWLEPTHGHDELVACAALALDAWAARVDAMASADSVATAAMTIAAAASSLILTRAGGAADAARLTTSSLGPGLAP
jgi:hypothetical protein